MGDKHYPQFVLFGDSITESGCDVLQPALQKFFNRRLDVINRGLAGYNTGHAMIALPKIFPNPGQARVSMLYIFFGANDASLPGFEFQQNVPLDRYKSNLYALATNPLVTVHQPRIILVTPPPVDEEIIDRFFEPGRRKAPVTARYAVAAREVAAKLDAENANGHGVAVCDLWTELIKNASENGEIPPESDWDQGKLPGDRRAPTSEKLRELLSDGLHFNPPAYEIMCGLLKRTILDKWPEMDPEKTDMVLPPWREAPKAIPKESA